MRTTIKDLARETGFSITAVSMALNGKNSRIPQETVDIIKKKAEELKYRPNALAVGLITSRTHTIGLIVPDNSNSFFASLSKDIEVAARARGYTVIYGNSDNKVKRDIEYFNLFVDKGVDGVIFARSQAQFEKENDELLQVVKNAYVPVVFVDRQFESYRTKSVVLNHRRGGFLATEHLLKIGHRKIGCITGSLQLTSSKERLKGYIEALEKYSMPYDESLIFQGDYDAETGQNALPYLLEKKVTAIFAFADMIACGVYKSARDNHVSIPKDISVVGFDNLFFSDILIPPLTTISQPITEMAKQSVKVLLGMIDNVVVTNEANEYIFEPSLIVRGSCVELNLEEK